MMRRIIGLAVLVISMTIVGLSFAQSGIDVYILGPSGGTGGEGFTDEIGQLDPMSHNVVKVHVYAGSVVEGIHLETYERGGGIVTPHHGGYGSTHYVFALQEGEYITGISGKYGTLVDSIQIHTNRRVSRLFGGPGGSADYIYEAPSGWEVAGFCGRAGEYLDAIGVVLRRQD